MATVRKYRERWVADFRDQNGRRRIEAPKGIFETSAFEKRAAKELLDLRMAEVRSHSYTPERQRLTFADLATQWLASKVKIRQTTIDDYGTMLTCYLVPYFGPRKIEAISRMDVERFRADMSGDDLPTSILAARDAKRLELQVQDPKARLKALEPGPRTTNKCLGILVSMFGYACDHKLVSSNVATRIDKLPETEGDESRVIEQNVLARMNCRRCSLTLAIPIASPSHWRCSAGYESAKSWG